MAAIKQLIQGEFRRLYDDRYRIALPPELSDLLGGDAADCVVAKEREGCLSLWSAEVWQQKVGRRIELLEHQLKLEFLDRDFDKVQQVVRLLSTRSRPVKLGQRGRFLIPEGFREFLGAGPNSEVLVVGAGICVEIWHPDSWKEYVKLNLADFNTLLGDLIKAT